MFSIETLKRSGILVFCLLTTFYASGCALASGQRLGALSQSVNPNPGRGLRIISVHEGSSASAAGLRPMDLLSKYGEFEVIDDASYFKAREAYEKSPGASVQIEVWRGNERLTPTVQVGRLGIDSNEYNPICYAFDALMDQVNALREIPEYQRDVEFKSQFAQGSEKNVAEARQMIDKAEREGTLTPTQILVARIYMIFDDAPTEALKQQSEMIAQLVSTQPAGFIEEVGSARFFEKKRYRPAIECFRQYLKTDPDNVSIRLNLGNACYHVGMFDEAEVAANYALKDSEGLSEHGFQVAWQVKAMAALGHQNYRNAVLYGEKLFNCEACRSSFEYSLVQLAAAQTGDLARVEEASRRFQEALPKKFEDVRFQIEAVEAFALVKNHQRDRARDLVMKWKAFPRIEGKLRSYWGAYPGGADVVKNWKELLGN
jgi:tetratricopeptide (TPR) repeat protein